MSCSAAVCVRVNRVIYQQQRCLLRLHHDDNMYMSVQIIRGIAMGLALIMYGREEEAETLIEQMSRDQDPILR